MRVCARARVRVCARVSASVHARVPAEAGAVRARARVSMLVLLHVGAHLSLVNKSAAVAAPVADR